MLHLEAPPLPSLMGVGEDTYGIGQVHPNRLNLGVFDLLVVTRGCLYMGENDLTFCVREGESLILYPNCHHFSTKGCDTETHFYWFHFSSNQWTTFNERSLTSNKDERKTSTIKSPFPELKFAIRIPQYCRIQNWRHFKQLCEEIQHTPLDVNPSSEWQKQLLFQQLLRELSNNNITHQSLSSVIIAEKAVSYIRKNFTHKLSYQDLGKALNFHPNHISRCMIKVVGYSPTDYLTRVRIEHAKLLLISKDWDIERIAENCGFSQQAYFSRQFKKHEGVTPNNFRKQYIVKKGNKG